MLNFSYKAKPKKRGTKHKVVLRCTDPHLLAQLPHLRADTADPAIVATLRAKSIQHPEFDPRRVGGKQNRKMLRIGLSNDDVEAIGSSHASIARTIMHSDAHGCTLDAIIHIRSIVLAPWVRHPSLAAALVANLRDRIRFDGAFVVMRNTAIQGGDASCRGKLVDSLSGPGQLLTPLPHHADLLWVAWGGEFLPPPDPNACLLDPKTTLLATADQRKRSSR